MQLIQQHARQNTLSACPWPVKWLTRGRMRTLALQHMHSKAAKLHSRRCVMGPGTDETLCQVATKHMSQHHVSA